MIPRDADGDVPGTPAPPPVVVRVVRVIRFGAGAEDFGRARRVRRGIAAALQLHDAGPWAGRGRHSLARAEGGVTWEVREGDSLRLLMGLPSRHVDAVVTDCPYSSGGMTRGDRANATLSKYVNSNSESGQALPEFLGDTRDQRSFGHWCALWYSECLRAAKDGALLFSFTDWRQLPATTDAVQAGGWVWRGIVPWNKTEATRPQLGRPRAQCEYLVFGTKGPHTPWDGAPTIPGFFECATPRERSHIAEKPITLMVDLLSLVPPDGIVLDPFCGSGSTGVAALRGGRSALLFELDPIIAENARTRMAAEEAGLSLRDAKAGQLSLLTGGAA